MPPGDRKRCCVRPPAGSSTIGGSRGSGGAHQTIQATSHLACRVGAEAQVRGRDRRIVRSVHSAWRARTHPIRQRTGIVVAKVVQDWIGAVRPRRLVSSGAVPRRLQRPASRRTARRRDLPLACRGWDRHRELGLKLLAFTPQYTSSCDSASATPILRLCFGKLAKASRDGAPFGGVSRLVGALNN